MSTISRISEIDMNDLHDVRGKASFRTCRFHSFSCRDV